MDKFFITVEPESAGMRIDAYLASVTDNSLSRTYIQKLMEQEQISVSGNVEKSKKYKVKAGDILELTIPEPESLDVSPENIPLDIVYEDEDVAVINKPKSMVVHPAPGNEHGTMVNALLYHCKDLSSIGGVIRPGIVHRIDKDTSGLIMIAKNDNAHISLTEQLKVHSITRVYNAIVFDNIKEDEGTVDAPIGRSPANRFKMAVVPDGRRAVTHYKVLERFGNFTYIEARLETGRTHQIRVHMAYIKHGFVHPRTGEYMEFTSELPEQFQQILVKLRSR